MLVPIINCCTSFYAGFVVFSTLGYMSKQKGVPIDEVAIAGLKILCSTNIRPISIRVMMKILKQQKIKIQWVLISQSLVL